MSTSVSLPFCPLQKYLSGQESNGKRPNDCPSEFIAKLNTYPSSGHSCHHASSKQSLSGCTRCPPPRWLPNTNQLPLASLITTARTWTPKLGRSIVKKTANQSKDLERLRWLRCLSPNLCKCYDPCLLLRLHQRHCGPAQPCRVSTQAIVASQAPCCSSRNAYAPECRGRQNKTLHPQAKLLSFRSRTMLKCAAMCCQH